MTRESADRRATAREKTRDIRAVNPATPFSSLINTHTHTQTATREWFYEENPARSGDTQRIAWMLLNFDDFYFDKYRREYHRVIAKALELFPHLQEMSLELAKTRWEHNVALYNGTSVLSSL